MAESGFPLLRYSEKCLGSTGSSLNQKYLLEEMRCLLNKVRQSPSPSCTGKSSYLTRPGALYCKTPSLIGWDSTKASSLETGFSASASVVVVPGASAVAGASTPVAPSDETELSAAMGLTVSGAGSAAVIG